MIKPLELVHGTPSDPTDPRILRIRIRSRIARSVSHPQAIEFTLQSGQVTLRGVALEHEAPALVETIAAIPGVHGVENQMQQVPAHSDLSPAGRHPHPVMVRLSPSHPGWSPRARVLAGLSGALAVLSSFWRVPGWSRFPLRFLGVSTLLHALTNQAASDWLSHLATPSMRLEREITLHAALDDVYDFLRDFSRFPKFMSFIRSVELNEEGGLRWVASGPAGIPVHWDSVVSELSRNRCIAWRALRGSIVHNSGRIRLRELGPEATLVHVELTYAPPAGALGYAVAQLLGFDPAARIDEDLEVLKTLIEGADAAVAARRAAS